MTSALRWGWVVSTTSRPLYPWERPGTHCIGGWVGPRAGLDGCGKSRPHRDSISDRPARSESLYRLSYPGPFSDKYKLHKYSVGRTYSCWMLNCWCITWPVGFKRLNCTKSEVLMEIEFVSALNTFSWGDDLIGSELPCIWSKLSSKLLYIHYTAHCNTTVTIKTN